MERRNPERTGFTSVFLAENDHMAVMAEIYMSLWDMHGIEAQPTYALVRTRKDAFSTLAACLPEAADYALQKLTA
jgi:hypothetical protein